MELKSRLENLTDKGKWAALGASLLTKVKATKAVWFPPGPAEAGGHVATTASGSARTAADEIKGSVDDVTDPRGGADT